LCIFDLFFNELKKYERFIRQKNFPSTNYGDIPRNHWRKMDHLGTGVLRYLEE